ncbi:MAG: HAMP domain-containing histidine kinase [Ruminococcaceae bacterium]|nr:HAMP domain-containing histidine kinase [Oscillospiraceae bacterium]
MNFKSITKSWLFNVFGIILIFLIAFEVVFSIVISTYYKDSVNQKITTTATVTAQFFNKYYKNQSSDFYSAAIKLTEDFEDKDKFELQIVDLNGKILSSSNGYIPINALETPDVEQAMWLSSASYTGKNLETNEDIMAVSVGLKDSSGNIRAIARFVVSLEKLNNYIILVILISIAICLFILALVFFSGSYYVNSFVKPLSKITEATKAIAEGNLTVSLDNNYSYEMGELVDSINNMAHELANTEQIKNDFISSISHELRTPLTAIKGWSETMLGCDITIDAPTVEHGLNVINDEAQRLTKMVEELLDFSKMQNSRLSMNMMRIDIGQILIETTYIMAERARREGIIIEYIPEGELPSVVGDPDRLKQVLINIIDNSIKHSEKEGNIQITAKEEDAYLKVFVRDFGKGIPSEILSKAKERFVKGPNSQRGSGLGLALSDEIMKLHNGKLIIESKENEGTTVTIVLPLETTDEE